MVRIEQMRIIPGAVYSREHQEPLFRRMSSKSLIPRPSMFSLATPTPARRANLATHSVASSSFTGLRSPGHGSKMSDRKYGVDRDRSPDREARRRVETSRISLPCVHGCCYCVYGRALGPVRLYMSHFTPQKDEKTIQGLTDGKGRTVFPVSRKREIKGLVYDQNTHSLHPPNVKQRDVANRANTSGYRSHVTGTSGYRHYLTGTFGYKHNLKGNSGLRHHVTGSSTTLAKYQRMWSSRQHMMH